MTYQFFREQLGWFRSRLVNRTSLTFLGLAIGLTATWQATADTIVNSKHNLSLNGPGTIKASAESDVCLFCHTIHKTTGQTPLWSHALSSVTNYLVYSSPTLKATVGQPDGSSRLCLSCHDGTVALGMVSSRTTTLGMQNGTTTLPSGPANLGTDLSDDHPISFVYDQNLVTQDNQLKNPANLDPKLKLDPLHKVQCVTCHDPHDNKNGSFLVLDNTASALCLGCHLQNGWPGSAHSLASSALTGPNTGKTSIPGTTPHANPTTGCQTCHSSHKAGSKARLLTQPKEEQNCFVCHNGKALLKDLAPEFSKPSAHPVLQTSSSHSRVEDPINGPRHVACADCHNSHAAVAGKKGGGPALANALAGVKGLNAAGTAIDPATAEYEVCFRCHAQSQRQAPARVPRQFPETNKRLQFQRSNQSFHPIEAAGRNSFVPSLIAPLNTSSVITCTDCHNNDQGAKAGGAGPNGPHGSAFAPLLERQLELQDERPESAATYALCYKCHSRSSILADQSFRAMNQFAQDRGHRFHIVDQRTACTTCHDSHGTARQAGLINFNTTYARPSANGRLEFVKTGRFSGNCSVTCHGKDHNASNYAPGRAFQPGKVLIPSTPSFPANRL